MASRIAIQPSHRAVPGVARVAMSAPLTCVPCAWEDHGIKGLEHEAKAEDPEVATLYRELYGPMRALATRYLGSAAEAEEAVSDTFVSFLKARHSLRSNHPAVLRSYLYTVLRNNLARRFGHVATIEIEEWMLPSPSDDREAPRSATTEESDLKEAIAQLPESLRTPLLLAYFENLPHKVIAERLSITVPAVWMRLFKAKRKLRSLLSQEPQPVAPGRGSRR